MHKMICVHGHLKVYVSVPVSSVPWWWYLVLNKHGDVHKHVMELLDAALQPDDVLVSGFDLVQGLLGDARVHDLQS